MDERGRGAIAEGVLASSRAEACEAIVACTDLALTRFTRNAVHQNVASEEIAVRVRAVDDGRVGVAETSDITTEGLRACAARALELARRAPRDPDFPGLQASPAAAAPAGAYATATADATPAQRAEIARAIFGVAEARGASAAGFVSTERRGVTIANSVGTRAHFDGTSATINVKAIARDSSGYAEGNAVDLRALDAVAIATHATEKALAAAAPIAVEPGAWTVVLEAAAFGELLSYLSGSFSAQRIADGASCFGELDRAYAGANVEIAEDAAHPLAPGMPFDWEGVPSRRTALLSGGVLRGMLTDARWARKLGRENTGNGLPAPNASGPQSMHLVVGAGDRSTEELIAGVERGLLVTRFWYIRPVDERKSIVTGMTRDGTFLIENGRVGAGVRNLRFNQSILEALGRAAFSAEQVRTGGYGYEIVAPTARIDGFRFSSTTEF